MDQVVFVGGSSNGAFKKLAWDETTDQTVLLGRGSGMAFKNETSLAEVTRMRGPLLGSNGSVPSWISVASSQPSPSLSPLNGLVRWACSWRLVNPSKSGSSSLSSRNPPPGLGILW